MVGETLETSATVSYFKNNRGGFSPGTASVWPDSNVRYENKNEKKDGFSYYIISHRDKAKKHVYSKEAT
ncbi:hypothetical protein HNY73_016979 [Argiope bruennichi]|uniref:Uncharacterized protein n=1 Tax=Argiope bruennichi TaxID=94029 RepID=A0A8T0EQF6_ARGBR|nr:hypothetical protein HNY73_016979 [Argiope bruennichi]